MNKKILAIAVAGLSTLFAAPVFAATPECCTNANPNCPKTETCPTNQRGTLACFDGLNLTADQKTKIEQFTKECREQCTRDNKTARAERRDNAAKFRTERLAKIKEILTPEQYVKFLENNFVNGHGQFGRNGGKHHKAARR